MLDDTSVNNESPESVIETPAAAEQITTPEPAPAVADDLPRPPAVVARRPVRQVHPR